MFVLMYTFCLELGPIVEISTWMDLHVEAQNLNTCKASVDSRHMQAFS